MPFWAFFLIIFVITVKTAWIIITYQTPVDGILTEIRNGECIVSQIDPKGPAEKSGLRIGDVVISVDSMRMEEFYFTHYILNYPAIDETAIYRIERDGKEKIILFTFGGLSAGILWFFTGVYILFILCSIASLYILLRTLGQQLHVFFLYTYNFSSLRRMPVFWNHILLFHFL